MAQSGLNISIKNETPTKSAVITRFSLLSALPPTLIAFYALHRAPPGNCVSTLTPPASARYSPTRYPLPACGKGKHIVAVSKPTPFLRGLYTFSLPAIAALLPREMAESSVWLCFSIVHSGANILLKLSFSAILSKYAQTNNVTTQATTPASRPTALSNGAPKPSPQSRMSKY